MPSNFTIDVAAFWAKTPKELKLSLLVVVIILGSYILFTRMPKSNDIQELNKIEQTIIITTKLVNEFDSFQKTQIEYNEELQKEINDLHYLIRELNDNINKKLNYMNVNNKADKDLIEKITLLNESYEKILKAYKRNDNGK